MKNNVYDNPWHSKEKQHEFQIIKLKKAFNLISSKYGLNDGAMSYIDFKIYCFIEHISVSSSENIIKEAGLPIVSDNYEQDKKYYENNIRIVGQFLNRFIKDTGKNEFTIEELKIYRDDKISNDEKFKNQFDKHPIRNLDSNLILKLGYKLYNHRVVKIEKVGMRDVYDLQLRGIHNFALTCGIFVHNCGALYFASQNIEQFSYNYGEDLDFTLQTNKLNSSPSEVKKQVNIAFEQELQNLLTPTSIRREQEEEKKRISNSPYGNRPIVTNGMLIW